MFGERRFAIGSIICGVIGLFYCGLILGCLALTFAAISIFKDYRGDEATSGLALGIICVCASLVQIMGLNYAFQQSKAYILYSLVMTDYFLGGSMASFDVIQYFVILSEMTSAHIRAISVAGGLGGPIPFYWFYWAVYYA